MGRLDDKIAVITGGGAGMGRVACERFAAEGARVVVADANGDAAAEVAAAIGDAARAVTVDVRDASQVEAMIRVAADTWGGLDVLYNNAGVSPGDDDTPL
ncbi:MAG: SDR family NAD(P)-dependent oxidoreductase, partial [Microthrixaceae bacterium]|nr:SDR family NAD(P)-dependent oxidoreductase [Microthrixaceae bacterium]